MSATPPKATHTILGGFETRRPLRAGSLIVTVFGDAIVPRGGSLWLGALLDIMGLFGSEAGLVRTALSRLVQDGLFERSRAGKNSYYRLSPQGARLFAAATHRIYRTHEPAWSGALDVALLGGLDPKARGAAREVLAALGFGQQAPTVLLRPVTDSQPDKPQLPDLVWLTAHIEGGPDAARALGASAWQLDAVAAGYTRFIETFAPLAAGRGKARLDAAEAFRLRILLIHEYRRIILRDPLLPKALLPADWPGFAARRLCQQLYRATARASENWLDAHGSAQGGALPAPDAAFHQRFAEA